MFWRVQRIKRFFFLKFGGTLHCGPEQPKIQTAGLGHSLIHSLVRSHRSHHSLVRLLAHFTHSLARREVNDLMAIYSVFCFILAHSALGNLWSWIFKATFLSNQPLTRKFPNMFIKYVALEFLPLLPVKLFGWINFLSHGVTWHMPCAFVMSIDFLQLCTLPLKSATFSICFLQGIQNAEVIFFCPIKLCR